MSTLDERLYAWLSEPDDGRFTVAFNSYFLAAFPAVVRHLARFALSDPALLGEIAQDSLLRFFEHIGRGRREASRAIEEALGQLRPVDLGSLHECQVRAWKVDVDSYRGSSMDFRLARGATAAERCKWDSLRQKLSRSVEILTAIGAFNDFARWVAARQGAAPHLREPTERMLAAARKARDEMTASTISHRLTPDSALENPWTTEVLKLLAAAATDSSSRPPELLTPRGFRVTLAYEEQSNARHSSICVLVRCPQHLIAQVQGKTVYLWSGAARFELGQFDADGKALGTLPAGIEISLSDFAQGIVKLEAPSGREDPGEQ